MNWLEKLSKIQVAFLALILGASLIFSAKVLSNNFSKNEITVTGSAYELVKSDNAVWNFQVKTSSPSRVNAYKELEAAKPKVKEFLLSKGIKKEEIELLGINSYPTYKTNPKTGYQSQDIQNYNYEQTIKVNSKDVELIKKVYLEIPGLVESGILIDANPPEYYYSELAQKKAELLEKATADAKLRAQGMLKATHNRVGKIRSVRMGVFQITRSDSNEVSDWGINDSSTIDKKITAVANVVFSIK